MWDKVSCSWSIEDLYELNIKMEGNSHGENDPFAEVPASTLWSRSSGQGESR